MPPIPLRQPMTTSSHAVLFTKQDCGPCTKAKEHVHYLLEGEPSLGKYLSVMQKENHSALVEAYNLDLFPVLFIVDSLGNEMGRLTGGRAVTNDLRGVLVALRSLDK